MTESESMAVRPKVLVAAHLSFHHGPRTSERGNPHKLSEPSMCSVFSHSSCEGYLKQCAVISMS